jgi:hypothetical protein
MSGVEGAEREDHDEREAGVGPVGSLAGVRKGCAYDGERRDRSEMGQNRPIARLLRRIGIDRSFGYLCSTVPVLERQGKILSRL